MKHRRQFVIAFVVIVLFVVGGFVGSFFRMRIGPTHEWFVRSFSGVIISRTGETIIVQDVHGVTKTFTLSPDTDIVSGKERATVASLVVGARVIISTGVPDGPESKVLAVRIFSAEFLPPIRRQ